jgi:hypothetical protein
MCWEWEACFVLWERCVQQPERLVNQIFLVWDISDIVDAPTPGKGLQPKGDVSGYKTFE